MGLRVGQKASLTKTFTQEDFNRFAVLSGDDNPIHVDEDFSARTHFGRTVAHGMLLYSTLSGLLGNELPGPGCWQVEQELMFPSPTFAGEPVTFSVELTRFLGDEHVELNTLVTRADGEAGATGSTKVRLPGIRHQPIVSFYPPIKTQGDEAGLEPSLQLKGLFIGQQASLKRSYTNSDLESYADLTGDTNPLFTDSVFAQREGFAAALIPGPLLGGLFSYLLGTKLPGRGTNWLKQRLQFKRPVSPQEEVTASVQIIRLRPEKNLVNLRTTCIDPAGALVCDGEALVAVRDLLVQENQASH
jgi:acyl dehydratase